MPVYVFEVSQDCKGDIYDVTGTASTPSVVGMTCISESVEFKHETDKVDSGEKCERSLKMLGQRRTNDSIQTAKIFILNCPFLSIGHSIVVFGEIIL